MPDQAGHDEKVTIDTDLPERGTLIHNADPELSYNLVLSVVVSSSDQAKSKFTYQWEKQMPGSSQWIAIEGATSSTYTIEGSDLRIDGSEVGRVGDGNYRVQIWNNLNRDFDPVTFAPAGVATINVTSSPIRVTHTASKPEANVVGDRTSFNLQEVRASGLTVSGVIKQEAGEYRNIDEDGMTFQWFKYKTGEGATTEELRSGTSSTYYPDAVGHYYCRVKNYYNGTDASQISRFFVVTDA